MWLKLERVTSQPVFYVGPREIVSHCPSCRVGTLGMVFMAGPRAVIRSQASGLGYCSLGCTEEMIGDALRVA